MEPEKPLFVERKRFKHVTPDEATPDTPLWLVSHKGKSVPFEFRGKRRFVRFGKPEPFASIEELKAFAEFVDAHPDFVLISGNEQDPIETASFSAIGNFIIFTTKGIAIPEPYSHVAPMKHAHSRLWVHQLPWSPVRPEYRYWAKDPLHADVVDRYYEAKITKEMLPSRQDSETARQIIEKLLPDASSRHLVLSLMADCIDANRHKPETWGVTLERSVVGLNIGGGFFCMQIKQDRVAVFFVPVDGDEALTTEAPFLTYKDVKKAWLSGDEIAAWIPRLRPGVLEFVQMAVQKFNRMNASIQRAHSPGVLRYMEQELARSIPDPVYPTTGGTSSARKTRYWRVGTREGMERVDRWPAMRDNDFISIGWSETGDLQQRLAGISPDAAVADLAAFFRDPPRNVNPGVATRYGQQWVAFLSEMDDGDVIAAMNGVQLLGIGVVSGDYAFDAQDAFQKHHRAVRWEWTGSKEWPGFPGARTTVHEFTDNGSAVRFIEQLREGQDSVTVSVGNVVYDGPLNTILYGPPGTGKTFNTLQRAVEIIDGQKPSNIASAKVRWDELRSEGRIEFVTFHQTYGYEDFIEGIRPVMDAAGDMTRYEIVDGLLKRMSMKALYEALESVPTEMGAPFPTLNQVWDAFLAEIEADPMKIYPGATPRTEFRLEVTERGTLWMRNIRNADTRVQTLSKDTLNDAWDALAQGHEQRANILMKTGNYPARRIVFANLKRLAEQMHGTETSTDDVDSDTEIPLDATHDYLRRGTESGYRLKQDMPPFVIVIDEINRGNISKIFGELITLIEDDKRIGGGMDLTVTLPYSCEKFGLPSNLYLLGTMNTADKSIALVDVALRRRFEFEELMPDFSTCSGLNADMRAVVEKLNRRIVLRKDRDHQIGHAFFVRVTNQNEFNRVFEKKVFPLLEEYFYGDWDALRFVLGEEDSAPKFIVEIEEAKDIRGARNRWQWYRDAGKSLDILATLKYNYRFSAVVEPLSLSQLTNGPVGSD